MKLLKSFKNKIKKIKGSRVMEAEGKKEFTEDEARDIAKKLNINFSKTRFTFDEFYMGVNVELEHGTRYPEANVTNDDPILTGKIALAHLLEFPDYYTRLANMEYEAKVYWVNRRWILKDNNYYLMNFIIVNIKGLYYYRYY